MSATGRARATGTANVPEMRPGQATREVRQPAQTGHGTRQPREVGTSAHAPQTVRLAGPEASAGAGADAPRAAAPPVLRLAPAPRAEPPAHGHDWPLAGTSPSSGAGVGGAGQPVESDPLYVQGSLAVDLRHEAYDSFFGPQATGTADLPDPAGWARRLITATLEACDGTRSAEQLSRWLTPEVRERVARRGMLARRRARRPHRPPRVRTLLTCHPADGVVEVSAVVQVDGRVRALALRMSGVDGRWLVTALELG